MGDQAIEPIRTDAKGSEGHYLSRRLWLTDKKETMQAFRQRLTADYVKAKRHPESHLQSPGYCYCILYRHRRGSWRRPTWRRT